MANIPQMPFEQEIDGDIDIKILRVLPPGAGHAFPRQWHMRKEGGGLFISVRVFFPYMMSSMNGWRDKWMDGWKKLHKRWPWCPLLYIIYILRKVFVLFFCEHAGLTTLLVLCYWRALDQMVCRVAISNQQSKNYWIYN
jgi:hypothetical protein